MGNQQPRAVATRHGTMMSHECIFLYTGPFRVPEPLPSALPVRPRTTGDIRTSGRRMYRDPHTVDAAAFFVYTLRPCGVYAVPTVRFIRRIYLDTMRTTDFDYSLPGELIAQYPQQKRDQSRLLRLARHTGALSHHIFKELPSLLQPGDRLVCNDTSVIPARLQCVKDTGTPVELLFLHPYTGAIAARCNETHCAPSATGIEEWVCMAKPRRRLRQGMELRCTQDSSVVFTVAAMPDDATVRVRPGRSGPGQGTVMDILDAYGTVPLPPYIERESDGVDRTRYQTVYARSPGSVAAPTAGLHFTDAVFTALRQRGIDVSFITLDVGPGTFRPVQTEDPHRHHMHEERFRVSRECARQIRDTRGRGGRIVAVGTTVVRVLEHCADVQGNPVPGQGSTRLMILPGYRFKTVDALITNFHLPRSTLLMLVSAFACRTHVLRAYRTAIAQRYRFYSYGDAMLLM